MAMHRPEACESLFGPPFPVRLTRRHVPRSPIGETAAGRWRGLRNGWLAETQQP